MPWGACPTSKVIAIGKEMKAMMNKWQPLIKPYCPMLPQTLLFLLFDIPLTLKYQECVFQPTAKKYGKIQDLYSINKVRSESWLKYTQVAQEVVVSRSILKKYAQVG